MGIVSFHAWAPGDLEVKHFAVQFPNRRTGTSEKEVSASLGRAGWRGEELAHHSDNIFSLFLWCEVAALAPRISFKSFQRKWYPGRERVMNVHVSTAVSARHCLPIFRHDKPNDHAILLPLLATNKEWTRSCSLHWNNVFPPKDGFPVAYLKNSFH